MFATTTRTADPRPVFKAAWAALILAAVVAAGAVIAIPRASADAPAPAVTTIDDRGLDASGLRRAPATTNDDRGLDASGLRRAPAVMTNDDHGLDGAAFRRAPASGNGSGHSGTGRGLTPQ